MKNTKILSILLITFVSITIWTQISDIKNYLVKSGVIKKNEEKFSTQGENLKAFPYFEASNLLEDIRNTNLPGPLNQIDENDISSLEETDTANIKQPNFDLYGVITETNLYRNNNELPSLEINETLNKMAEEKLNDMFNRGYFEHVSPQGIDIEDLADEHNYEYLVIGENLALGGFKTSTDVVRAWSESEPHRKNMLDERYTEIGVAVKRALYKGHPATIIVQHFGKSTSSCPTVSKQTKDSIDNTQQELKTLKDKIEELKKQIEEDYRENLVEEHNKLVSTYNKKLASLKSKVEEYNTQVEKFNNCVQKTNS
ncbi:MAG TPA: CAP domain-containing protein [Candidatus Paceibacterota bacterium]|nr:CAP domain-containing protein [Candidatus Paceibacterota bacterium]